MFLGNGQDLLKVQWYDAALMVSCFSAFNCSAVHLGTQPTTKDKGFSPYGPPEGHAPDSWICTCPQPVVQLLKFITIQRASRNIEINLRKTWWPSEEGVPECGVIHGTFLFGVRIDLEGTQGRPRYPRWWS